MIFPLFMILMLFTQKSTCTPELVIVIFMQVHILANITWLLVPVLFRSLFFLHIINQIQTSRSNVLFCYCSLASFPKSKPRFSFGEFVVWAQEMPSSLLWHVSWHAVVHYLHYFWTPTSTFSSNRPFCSCQFKRGKSLGQVYPVHAPGLSSTCTRLTYLRSILPIFLFFWPCLQYVVIHQNNFRRNWEGETKTGKKKHELLAVLNYHQVTKCFPKMVVKQLSSWEKCCTISMQYWKNVIVEGSCEDFQDSFSFRSAGQRFAMKSSPL